MAAGLFGGGRGQRRKMDTDAGAFSRLAIGSDKAAMAFYDSEGGGKPEPRAFSYAFGCEKWVVDPVNVIRMDTMPGVFYFNAYVGADGCIEIGSGVIAVDVFVGSGNE